MVAIIVINIRKRKENQFSILIRILTNYLQLISISLSFTPNISASFSSAFSAPTDTTAPDEVLLSFDCFIEDVEAKAFVPSVKLFKAFLLAFLPLILIALMAIVILIFDGIVKLSHPGKLTPQRYIIISVVCIIFLLHPSITLEALSLFECIEIDEGVSRMKLHMEYGCLSAEHALWMFGLGLPMIALWVIGMPLVALIIIVKNRHNLDDWKVKQYMLMLYQGLKPNAFYWEFMNIGRKLLVL